MGNESIHPASTVFMSERVYSANDVLRLCREHSEWQVQRVIQELRPGSDLVSQHEAIRMWGRKQIDRWRNEHRLVPRRMGGAKNAKLCYSIAEMRALAFCDDFYGTAVEERWKEECAMRRRHSEIMASLGEN